jgi:AraC-like DNA-binding protein
MPALTRTRPDVHQVTQYRSALAGIEAMALFSNRSFPRHTHDHYGIGIMTAGAQRSWSVIGDVESEQGDVIMCNPGEMHDGLPATDRPRGWRIIYLDPALVAGELADDAVATELTVQPVVRSARLGSLVNALFAQLQQGAADPAAAEESLVSCLMEIAQHHRVDRRPGGCAAPSVARVIEQLEAAPEMPLSLAELARSAGISRFQLLRGFARATGTTPHAYVMQLRAKKARQLLAGGELPAEAAQLAGFADQSHLTRAFVKYFGITPARYRAATAPDNRPRRATARNFVQDVLAGAAHNR